MPGNKFIVVIFSLLLFLNLSEKSFSANFLASWQVKNRFQVGAELDDNIYESRFEPQSEPSLRLLFQSNGKRQWSNLIANFRVTGGYQAYKTETREDKFTNECQLSSEMRFYKAVYFGFNFQWRSKIFIFEPIDYAFLSSNFYTRVELPLQVSLFLFYQPQSLNYRASMFYDFHGAEIGVALSKNFSRHLLLEANLSRNQLNYKREIYKLTAPNQLFYLNEKQRDELLVFSLQASYLSFFLAKFGYFYEDNASNNFGFSYQKHNWVLNFSKKFFSHYLVQFYLTFQNKKYNDLFGPFFQMQLDTEKEDNNFFIFDISRSLTAKSSVFLRLGYYNNESPFRSEYYQKRLITSGIEIRF